MSKTCFLQFFFGLKSECTPIYLHFTQQLHQCRCQTRFVKSLRSHTKSYHNWIFQRTLHAFEWRRSRCKREPEHFGADVWCVLTTSWTVDKIAARYRRSSCHGSGSDSRPSYLYHNSSYDIGEDRVPARLIWKLIVCLFPFPSVSLV